MSLILGKVSNTEWNTIHQTVTIITTNPARVQLFFNLSNVVQLYSLLLAQGNLFSLHMTCDICLEDTLKLDTKITISQGILTWKKYAGDLVSPQCRLFLLSASKKVSSQKLRHFAVRVLFFYYKFSKGPVDELVYVYVIYL